MREVLYHTLPIMNQRRFFAFASSLAFRRWNKTAIIGTIIVVIVLIGAGAFFILRKRKPEEEQQVLEDAPIDITPNDKN